MATVIVEEEVVKGQRDVDSVDIGKLRVVTGCCCGLSSLYCHGKKSCGCQSKGTLISNSKLEYLHTTNNIRLEVEYLTVHTVQGRAT